jgi:AcrR family transcriptional regulator
VAIEALPPIHRGRGRPSLEDAEALSELILSNAYALLCEQGFANTTMSAVADRANVVRRSVSHRFRNKDELLVATLRWSRKYGILASVLARPGIEEPLDDLREVCRILLMSVTAPSSVTYFRILLGELGRLPVIGEVLLAENDEIAAVLQDLILKVQQAGHMQRLSANTLATTIIGMLLSNPVNRGMLGDPRFGSPHELELYFSQVWALLLSMA